MDRLTAIFPRARTLPLGAGLYRVWELRFSDLADLQECFEQVQGDVFEEGMERLEGAESAERHTIVTGLYEALEAGLPTIMDEKGTVWLATTEGLASLLLIALRRGHPKVTPSECVTLASEISAPQFARLQRVAFGMRPLRIVERMLGLVDERSGPRLSWAQVISEVCERYGWAPDVVEGLTLSQFALFRSRGESEEAGREVGDEKDLGRLVREQYRRYHGREMGADGPTANEPESRV